MRSFTSSHVVQTKHRIELVTYVADLCGGLLSERNDGGNNNFCTNVELAYTFFKSLQDKKPRISSLEILE